MNYGRLASHGSIMLLSIILGMPESMLPEPLQVCKGILLSVLKFNLHQRCISL